MSGVEYRFDGLDEWEKKLAQAIEQQFPKEFEQMVIDIAYELQGKTKERTPHKSGFLQDHWFVGDIVKRGKEYYIEVYNDTEYADHVEYGHRVRGKKGKPGKKVVPGVHMLELSLEEVNDRLPGFLRDWLSEFIETHDLV